MHLHFLHRIDRIRHIGNRRLRQDDGAAQQPEEQAMKAVVESAGKVAGRVRLGAHELTFDQPPTVPGGDDRGPSPLDVLVASVAACAHYFAAAYLHGRGLPTAQLTVEVDGEKVRSPTPRLGRLAMKVTLPAGLSDQQRAAIERAIRGCPAWGTLVHPPDLDFTIETAAAPPTATESPAA